MAAYYPSDLCAQMGESALAPKRAQGIARQRGLLVT